VFFAEDEEACCVVFEVLDSGWDRFILFIFVVCGKCVCKGAYLLVDDFNLVGKGLTVWFRVCCCWCGGRDGMQCVLYGIFKVAVSICDCLEEEWVAGDEVGGWVELVKVVVFGMFKEGLCSGLDCCFHGGSVCKEDGVFLLECDGSVDEFLFGIEGGALDVEFVWDEPWDWIFGGGVRMSSC